MRRKPKRLSVIHSSKSPLVGRRGLMGPGHSRLTLKDGPPSPRALAAALTAVNRGDESAFDEELTRDPRLATEPLAFEPGEQFGERLLRVSARGAFGHHPAGAVRAHIGASVFARGLGLTLLHAAAARGEASIVLRLLADGACPTAPSSSGDTPFLLACRLGHTDAARAMLSFVSDNDPDQLPFLLSHVDARGDSALHATRAAIASPPPPPPKEDDQQEQQARAEQARRRDSELRALAARLQDLGADPYQRNRAGRAPVDLEDAVDGDLDAAAWAGRLDRARELLDRSEPPPPLGTATVPETTTKALQRKPTPPVLEPVDAALAAAIRGHTPVLRLLVDAGQVDAAAASPYTNRTLVHRCADLGLGAAIDTLPAEAVAAALPIRDQRGRTPLLQALESGHEAVALQLLRLAPDPLLLLALPDVDGLSPLHMAAARALPRALRALVEAGAPVNRCSEFDDFAPVLEPPFRLTHTLMHRMQTLGFLHGTGGGVRSVLRRVHFDDALEPRLRRLLVCSPLLHELATVGLVPGGPAWRLFKQKRLPFHVFRRVLADFETVYESLRDDDMGDWLESYERELEANAPVARLVHRTSHDAHVRASPAAAAAASAATVLSADALRRKSSALLAPITTAAPPPPKPKPRSSKPRTIETPLHTAVRSCGLAVVQQLLAHGADVDARDPEGRRPLRVLVDLQIELQRPAFGHVLRALLAAGADPSALDGDGLSPMHSVVAAYRMRPDVLRTLLTCAERIDVNQLSAAGDAAITLAARRGRAAFVRLLLAHGAIAPLEALEAAASMRPEAPRPPPAMRRPQARQRQRPRQTRMVLPKPTDNGLINEATRAETTDGEDGDEPEQAPPIHRLLMRALGPASSAELLPVLRAAALAANTPVVDFLLRNCGFKADDLTAVLAALLAHPRGQHKRYPPAQVRQRWWRPEPMKPTKAEQRCYDEATALDAIAASLVRRGASPTAGVTTSRDTPALLTAARRGWFALAQAMFDAGAVPDVEPVSAKRWGGEPAHESPLVYAARASLLFQFPDVGAAGERFAAAIIPGARRANADWWAELLPKTRPVAGEVVRRLAHITDAHTAKAMALRVLDACLLATPADLDLATTNTNTILQRLLETGLLPPGAGAGQESALFVAARHGDEALVRLLYRHGACLLAVSPDTSPLLAAAKHDHRGVVRAMHELDVDGFVAHAEQALGRDGMTVLHHAAVRAWQDVATWILDRAPAAAKRHVPWVREAWFSRAVTPWAHTSDGVFDEIEHHDTALSLVLNPRRLVAPLTLRGVPGARWGRPAACKGAALAGWQEPRSAAALDDMRARDEIANALVLAGAPLRGRDRASGLDMLDLACAAGAWLTADTLLRESMWARQMRPTAAAHFVALLAAASDGNEDRRRRNLALMSARGVSGVPAAVDQHVLNALGRSAIDELVRRGDLEALPKTLGMFEVKAAASSVKRFAQQPRQLFFEASLLRAAAGGNDEAALLILDRCPSAAQGANLVPAIHACARGGATETLDAILDDTYVAVSLDACVLAALSRGHSDAVVTLLQAYDSEAALPLLPLACWHCSIEFLREAVDDPAGVDLEQQDADGFSALDNALAAGRSDVVALLLTRGARRRQTLLYAPSLAPDVEHGWFGAPGWLSSALATHAEMCPGSSSTMASLIGHASCEGLDVPSDRSMAARKQRAEARQGVAMEVPDEDEEHFSNAKWDLGSPDAAARHGLDYLLHAMIDHGLDLSCTDAMFHACANGHAGVVELLLETGASPNGHPERTRSRSPLMAAAQGAHLECIELLLEHGAAPGHVTLDTRERNWLHCLALAPRAALDADEAAHAVGLYLESGSLDALDAYGCTPLAIAAAVGNTTLAAALVAQGATNGGQRLLVGSPRALERMQEAVGQIEMETPAPTPARCHGACERTVCDAEDAERGAMRALMDRLLSARWQLRSLLRGPAPGRRELARAQALVPMFLPPWRSARAALGLGEWHGVLGFLAPPDAAAARCAGRLLSSARPDHPPALALGCRRGRRAHPLLHERLRAVHREAVALLTVVSVGPAEALTTALAVRGFPPDLLPLLRRPRRPRRPKMPVTAVRRFLCFRDAGALACAFRAAAKLEARRRERHRRRPKPGTPQVTCRGAIQPRAAAKHEYERFVIPRMPADRDGAADARRLRRRGYVTLPLLRAVHPHDLLGMGFAREQARATAARLRRDVEKHERRKSETAGSIAGLVLSLTAGGVAGPGAGPSSSSASASATPIGSRSNSVVGGQPTAAAGGGGGKKKTATELVLALQRRCGNVFSGAGGQQQRRARRASVAQTAKAATPKKPKHLLPKAKREACAGPQRAFEQLRAERKALAAARQERRAQKRAAAEHSHATRRTLIAESSVEGALVHAASAYGFQLNRSVRHNLSKSQQATRSVGEAGATLAMDKCGVRLVVPPQAVARATVRVDTVAPQNVEARPADAVSPVVRVRFLGAEDPLQVLQRPAVLTVSHSAASTSPAELELMTADDVNAKAWTPVPRVTWAQRRAVLRTRALACYYVRWKPAAEDRPVRMHALAYIGPPLPGAVELSVQVWFVAARDDAVTEIRRYVALPGIDLRLVGSLPSLVLRRRQTVRVALALASGAEVAAAELTLSGKAAETVHLSIPMACVDRRGASRMRAVVDGQEFAVDPLRAVPGLQCPLGCDALLVSEEDVADHGCPRRAVACPNGCEAAGLRARELPAHLASECLNRGELQCPNGCGAVMASVVERRAHLFDLCPRRDAAGLTLVRESQLREALRVKARQRRAAEEQQAAASKQGAMRRMTKARGSMIRF